MTNAKEQRTQHTNQIRNSPDIYSSPSGSIYRPRDGDNIPSNAQMAIITNAGPGGCADKVYNEYWIKFAHMNWDAIAGRYTVVPTNESIEKAIDLTCIRANEDLSYNRNYVLDDIVYVIPMDVDGSVEYVILKQYNSQRIIRVNTLISTTTNNIYAGQVMTLPDVMVVTDANDLTNYDNQFITPSTSINNCFFWDLAAGYYNTQLQTSIVTYMYAIGTQLSSMSYGVSPYSQLGVLPVYFGYLIASPFRYINQNYGT